MGKENWTKEKVQSVKKKSSNGGPSNRRGARKEEGLGGGGFLEGKGEGGGKRAVVKNAGHG